MVDEEEIEKDKKEFGGLVQKRDTPIKPQKAPSPPKQYQGTETKYNSKSIQMLLDIKALPSISLLDSKQVSDRVDEYFDMCIDRNVKPTEAGLCLAIGISKAQFREWVNGGTEYNPKQKAIAERALQMLEALSEQYLLDNETYSASIIFYLKNKFGYKDETERTISIKEKYDQSTAEDIRQEYLKERQTIIDNDTPNEQDIIDAEFEPPKNK